VRDGSTFRILLILPDQTQQVITLHLSGIKAPSCKRDNDESSVSEPFGEECKFFVESRLLQRGVKVILESLAQSGGSNFVGSIQHPAGNISELLLSQGLAKCVDWSITLATSGPAPLRAAEKAAKEKKLRLWRDFVSTKKKDDTQFDAVVVRIVTGDTVIVKPKNSSVEKKLQLASVKQAPRGAGSTVPGAAGGKSRDIKEVGYQFEAREFLRKKLIGKQVHVTIDYHKPAQEGFEAKDCATITLGNNNNIAEQLIARGLATVIRHRKDDDNRSHCYDQLLMAEKKAEEEKKGVHSPKEQPVVRIVDASESAAKSRQFLTFLKRSGKTHAVVDFVANGSRLFVWVPKENCRLTFVLSGVRAPRVGRTANDKSEPYGQEALEYVSQKCLQHDVEIEVENVDKVGSFVGSLFVNGENLAVSLLSRGLAYIHEYSADESHYVNQLYGAEREAKAAKKGVWADYQEESSAEQASANTAGPNREYIDVVVSDIISGSHFYVQKVTDEIPKLEKLMSDLGQYQNGRPADPAFKPRVGENVSAKFTEDDCWYRGRVRRISHEGIEVLYIDFGNAETLPLSRVRSLPENFKQLKAQALEATLSFVKSPEVSEDYGIEALERFRELTGNKQLVANVDAREGNVMSLTLYDFRKSTSAEASINLDMVQDGQAFVTPKVKYARGNETIIKALEAAQEEAIRRRLGMFEYGDITGNEDVTSSSRY
jgi:staphylococcal nuclease domain-containing protein 1